MWSYSYHRFETQKAFEQVFNSLGWTKDPHTQEYNLPDYVVIDVIGAVDITPNGNPSLKYRDTRFHVNMAWHSTNIPPELEPSIVTPSSPSRIFAQSRR